MQAPAAILIGAALIAVAIVATNHWTVVPAGYQGLAPQAIRLNRWTGAIDVCVVDADTMRNPNSFAGAEFACAAK